jgi:hypothetical protein
MSVVTHKAAAPRGFGRVNNVSEVAAFDRNVTRLTRLDMI